MTSKRQYTITKEHRDRALSILMRLKLAGINAEGDFPKLTARATDPGRPWVDPGELDDPEEYLANWEANVGNFCKNALR
jgi:hypothetical protein